MKQGFTLVELVVVLTIASIATAVAVPALGRLLEEDSAPTIPLVEVLNGARATAMATASPTTVMFVPESGRYRVWTDSPEGRMIIADSTIAMPTGGRIIARSIRPQFVFDASGYAVADTILLEMGDRIAVVSVDPWVGEVRVAPR